MKGLSNVYVYVCFFCLLQKKDEYNKSTCCVMDTDQKTKNPSHIIIHHHSSSSSVNKVKTTKKWRIRTKKEKKSKESKEKDKEEKEKKEEEKKEDSGARRRNLNRGNKRKPGMDEENDVDKLVNAARIIPKSCLEYRDSPFDKLACVQSSGISFTRNRRWTSYAMDSEFSPAGQSKSWVYDMSAWDTIQEKGHGGTGGSCIGMEHTEKWSEVVAFYNKHRLAKYCSITAERMVWTKQKDIILDEKTGKFSHYDDTKDVKDANVCGSSQYAKLYLRCVGCGCADESMLPDWVANWWNRLPGCTDASGKPGVATAEEKKAIAGYVYRMGDSYCRFGM